jgi:acetoin utilization deacetylase AcuC-like enzyme
MTLHESHREEHPERPERVMAIYLNLLDKGIYDQLIKLESDEATEEELLLVHPKSHVNSVMNASKDLKTN